MMTARINLEPLFKPVAFATLSYKRQRYDAGQLDYDIRQYVLWLCRRFGAHLRVVVGYELGSNTHIHLIFYSADLELTQELIDTAKSKRAWKHGRVTDFSPYDPDKGLGAFIYTTGHDVLPMAGEIFCPRRKKCRKDGKCIYGTTVGKRTLM